MKKNLFYPATLALSLLATTVLAQNVAINEDGSLPSPNAILDVKSFTKGVLIPRVSTSARLAIPNTKGLLLYDTTAGGFWYNTGAAWQSLTLVGGKTDSLLYNSFWGYKAGISTTALGAYNTAVGGGALELTTSGLYNTATGTFALHSNTIAGFNTATGVNALYSDSSGYNNTATGTLSLYSNKTGGYNTANGSNSLYNSISGYENVAIGASTLYNNTTGFQNTAVGSYSLTNNTTGSYNTAVGYNANVTGGNLTNATAIGNGATVNASNKVRIGNSAVTVIEGQVPFTTPSDGRYKYQVKEDVKGLDFIMQLRPITYQFDVKRFDALQRQGQNDKNAVPAGNILQASYDEAAAIRRSGFIAQEVEKAADASGYNFSGIIKPGTEREHYSLSYESFVVPLVKGMQEQQQLINRQEQTIRRQEQKLAEQDAKAAQQEKKLAELQQQLSELNQFVHSIK